MLSSLEILSTVFGLVCLILGLILLFAPESEEVKEWKKKHTDVPANLHRNAMIVGGVLIGLGVVVLGASVMKIMSADNSSFSYGKSLSLF